MYKERYYLINKMTLIVVVIDGFVTLFDVILFLYMIYFKV